MEQVSDELAAAHSDVAARLVIRLDRSSGQELGLQVDQETLDIDDVEVGGLVAAWNESSPAQAVRAGDRIVEVNGQTTVAAIVAECQRAHILTVAVLRQAPLRVSLLDSEQRLRELQAKLRARMSTTAEPGLKRALLQVESALGVPDSAAFSAAGGAYHSEPPPAISGVIPRAAPPSDNSGRRSDASLFSSATGANPLSEDLEELVHRVPARVNECLRSGFAKLLGEIAATERRFEAQTKTGADLATALAPSEAVRQRLREVEERYMKFCAVHNGGAQAATLRRINEATTRTQSFQLRLDEKLREIQDLKRQLRLADEEWEAQKAKLAAKGAHHGNVTSLANEIQEKSKLKAKLERELPGYLSVIEEHKLMRSRIAELKARRTANESNERRAVSPTAK